MCKIFVALTAMILGGWVAEQAVAEPDTKLPTPIIAQLVAEPEIFAGRTVLIYGLVVESEPTTGMFMLQDVSQRPLQVVGSRRTVNVGDELTVIGVFKLDRAEPYIAANILIPTRVLAGGGCC